MPNDGPIKVSRNSHHMTTVGEIIKRDIGVKVEGVVKVFDRSALANEVREYVVTDKIEDELKRMSTRLPK